MMAGIGSKDTKPELAIRKILHAQGFRYRLHRKDLPGRPDIVLPKHRTVIFVHGCFWHGHRNCRLFRIPYSRSEFWEQKIGLNIARDARVHAELGEAGWNVVDVWECAVKGSGRVGTGALSEILERAIIDRTPLEIRGTAYLE